MHPLQKIEFASDKANGVPLFEIVCKRGGFVCCCGILLQNFLFIISTTNQETSKLTNKKRQPSFDKQNFPYCLFALKFLG